MAASTRKSSIIKLALLGSLYFSQGLPYGFFTQALPSLMREQGADLPTIGLAGLLTFPWALKFLWAPVIDGFGRRKHWIIALQMSSCAALFVLGRIDTQSGFAYLLYGYAFINLLAATQDIAADGLAVGLLKPEERGFGNGFQVAGYRLGMIFGGGFLLLVFATIQWRGSFDVMAVITLTATLPIILYNDREDVVEEIPNPPTLRELYTNVFKRKGFFLWLLLIAFFKFGDSMVIYMIRPQLKDAGWTLAQIGQLFGLVGFVAGLLGALAGGWLVTHLGRYRSIFWFGIFQAVAVGAYLPMTVGPIDENLLYVVCAADHFLGGMATVALFTAMMDVCRVESGGTDYTVQASAVVISAGSSHVAAGWAAEIFGYDGNILIGTTLSLMGALVFGFIFRRRIREKTPLRLPFTPNSD